MIVQNDSIRYRNVVSKKYYFADKEMAEIIKDFVNEVLKCGYTVKGPLFYAINNVPMDGMIKGEFFISVNEADVKVPEDMEFQSYFCIESMIGCCVIDNFELKMESAYAFLFDHIEKNNLSQVTPIFHIIASDKSLNYMFVKIGVAENE